MSSRERRRPAALNISKRAHDINDLSWNIDANNSTFTRGDMQISSKGIQDDSVIESEQTSSKGRWLKSIDELEFGATLGRGSSGYAQHATHRPTGRELAVKVINVFDKSLRDQLLKEIEMLFQADCPSLVDFYGAFYRDGSILIAMELMDAGSLYDVSKKAGRMPENALGEITLQVLTGLEYLHKQKHVVHRDIKPSNLLLDLEGHCKLTDFGITRDLQNSIAVCETFVGTTFYMSPERIKGEEYNYLSDLWSLGLCLLECSLGRFPYPDTGVYIELVQSIVNAPVPDGPEDFSAEFADFVRKCMNKDPSKRPPATELLNHPWIVEAKTRKFDLKSWIQSLSKCT
eukprot:15626_1